MTSNPPRLAVALLAAVALIVLSAGCAHLSGPAAPAVAATTLTPTPVPDARPVDPSLLQPPANPFTLGPGDQLEIEVLGDPSTRETTTVGPDGKIYFYVLPGLDVWGLTLSQTRDRIGEELQKFVREKQSIAVTLHGVASQRVWLLGRLNKPGVYPMAGPTTLLDAIAQAGGPASASALATLAGSLGVSSRGATDEAADLGHSFVVRHGQLLSVDFYRLLREGDLSQNIYLQPDDFVYLPSGAAQSVHVLGAVAQPRSVNFVNRLTLVQTIASAGGTIKDAYLSHVAVVRGSLTEPKVAIVDYQAVARGQAPDVLLEPHDIVYVPFTPYRTLTRYVDMILDTFARTVGVNEGARAISGSVLPVGVNVPVGP